MDHFLLQVHHVRGDLTPDPAQLAWDIGFLAWGAMLAVGWAWTRAEAVFRQRMI